MVIIPGPRIEKDKTYFIIIVNEAYEHEYSVIYNNYSALHLSSPKTQFHEINTQKTQSSFEYNLHMFQFYAVIIP